MQASLFTHIQGVHLLEEAVVFKVLLILVMSMSKLHIELDSLQDDATLLCMPVATAESSLSI